MIGFPVPRPWAKLRRACAKGKTGCRETCACPILGSLSLIGHSADVAAVLRCLLGLPVVRSRLARLARAEDLSEPALDRLAAVAAPHDAGKPNHGFQNRALPPDIAGPRAGHVAPLWALLDERIGTHDRRVWQGFYQRLVEALGLEEMATWLPEAGIEDALLALMAHHGSLPGGGERFRAELWQPQDGYDPIAAVGELAAAVRGWFPEAFAPGPPLPWSRRFAHAYAGLLMLADWLGSHERWFPFADGSAPDGPDRFTWSMAQARAALAALYLEPSPARAVAAALPWEFHTLFPKLGPPWPTQAEMLKPLPPEARLVVLEAETGSGKTQAALLHHLRLFRQGQVDGLYFALPTRAAAIQIQDRIRKDVERLLGFCQASCHCLPLADEGWIGYRAAPHRGGRECSAWNAGRRR